MRWSPLRKDGTSSTLTGVQRHWHDRQQLQKKKKKMDKDDEERIQQAIEQQIERALASKKDEDDAETVYTELMRQSEEERISFSLNLGGASVAHQLMKTPPNYHIPRQDWRQGRT